MLDEDIVAASQHLFDICRRKNLKVATAESCTGGLVAGTLTEIPGSSHLLDRGFVTYSHDSKSQMLGVPEDVLKQYGAVSRETAEAMAKGALGYAPVDLTIAVTGIAGPGGDEGGKPIGLVHFAAASRSGLLQHVEMRFGNPGRSEVRKRSVLQAFVMLHDLAEKEPARR
jgi:nicotinamide-nucleotide amidase